MSARRPSPLGIVVALGLTAAMAGLSRLPYAAEPEGRALLRLSWRYQPEGEEDCRRPTAEDLAELPQHMQNPDACIRSATPYRLTLIVDGERLRTDTLRAPGARQDRPLSVLVDHAIEAGRHEVDVRFEALSPTDRAPDESTEGALSWAGTITIEPREIALIGYDRPTRSLVRVTAARDSMRP